jgi:hypothetical protein
MYKTIYPIKDSTIYEQTPDKNTGVDQILELIKITSGTPVRENDDNVTYDNTYNSRILMQFNLNELSHAISTNNISQNFKSELILRSTYAESLPFEYTLVAHPISSSWINGPGYANNNPYTTAGVSWKYRDSYFQGTEWFGDSMAYATEEGGGTWLNYTASQSFQGEDPDVRMDVTNLVKLWLSGSIENNGLIIKYENSIEQDDTILGTLQFFSRESHTIYHPRLEITWNDAILNGTGSFNEIDINNSIVYLKNLRESYKVNEIVKINVGTRENIPQYTYTTSSYNITPKRLPVTSYYYVTDFVTEEVIIPFSTNNQISCDINGNFLKLDMASLSPERYYRLIIRSENDNNVVIFNDSYVFKVIR